MKQNNKFMKLAIREARKNFKTLHGGPFGACIVKRGKIIAIARNTVLKSKDATCHAEMNAIRIASKKLKNFDLSGCVVYSTTEPCPMCFCAIHWAKIDTVVYGSKTNDAKKAGFGELNISDFKLKSMGKSKVKLFRSPLVKECEKLFFDWVKMPEKRFY